MVIFHCYVSLPEGITSIKVIYHYNPIFNCEGTDTTVDKCQACLMVNKPFCGL